MSSVGSRWYDDPVKGTFMCCICFEQVKFEDAWQCEHGCKWDNCARCSSKVVCYCEVED